MQDHRYILLAEDDIDDQLLLTESLRETAPTLRIECFINGQEIVDFLSQSSADSLPSLIILDYNMPRFNGLEVLKWLNADSRYAGIPRVVWSTSHTEQVATECIKQGARDYFKKPVNQDGYDTLAGKMLEIVPLQ